MIDLFTRDEEEVLNVLSKIRCKSKLKDVKEISLEVKKKGKRNLACGKLGIHKVRVVESKVRSLMM